MPKPIQRFAWALIVPGALTAWWVAQIIFSDAPPPAAASSPPPPPKATRAEPRIQTPPPTNAESTASPVKPNEMLAKFGSASEMAAFLAALPKTGARVLASISSLNAVRIGYDTPAQSAAIRKILPTSAHAEANALLTLPNPPESQTDPGGPYLGFGQEALTWLGVPENNAHWGEGVQVAVLDSGVSGLPSASFKELTQLDLLETGIPTTPEATAHGTAVAAILNARSDSYPGIAPAAELLSVRVMDPNGTGDSFTVARGIVAAVDAGARIISMSIGTSSDSTILRDAVNYALARNVAVVAAVGNDGTNTVSYPAAYPGVVAVTAVDARGQRGTFANHGPEVSLAAPGIGVSTPASTQDSGTFSGTSAAVPFVSGTLAMMLSENPGMTAPQATRLMLDALDDAGAPGHDPFYGTGILNVERLITRNQPGIHDAAIADYYVDVAKAGASGVPVQITIQNRGTSTLTGVTLEVTSNRQPRQFYMSGLPPGAIRSESLLLSPTDLRSESGVTISSTLKTNGVQDARPANNQRTMTLRLAPR